MSAELTDEKIDEGGFVSNLQPQNIPWLNIIRFHKEIVSRAEDQFFALEGGSPDHSRWTSLRSFDPCGSAGPWEVQSNDFKSETFRRHLDQGTHESCFIGTACYRSDINLQGEWKARWVPLLYREVEIREEEGVFKVNPLAGSWSLSPLFLSLLERLEIRPKDDLVRQLLGEVHGDNHSFSEQVLNALFRLYPEVRRDLMSPTPNGWVDTPSSWVLFAPTTVFGAFIRHLMADYTALENALIQNVKNIGGLGVLGTASFVASNEDVDLLPVVPLNSSQRKAAEAVFREKPVTVISGPPGTGKSQVAVSVLLNAWAQGKKCLFVSNNNKAVNVVNERLRALQGGTPVVVRAGSSQENTIVPDLTRILTLLAGTGDGTETEASREKILPLEKERDDLVVFLEDRRGKKIDDLRKTTFEAYQEYNLSLENIKNEKRVLDDELISLGGETGASLSDAETAFKATKVWIDLFSDALRLREQDDAQRDVLKQGIRACESLRNNALNTLGVRVETSENCHWLIDGLQPAWLFDWKQKLEPLLGSDLNRVFAETLYRFQFPELHTSGDVQHLKTKMHSFLDDLNNWVVGLQGRLDERSEFNKNFEKSRQRLASYGVPLESIRCKMSEVVEWVDAFNEYESIPRRWFDTFPFSPRKKLDRKLSVLERTFRKSFPAKYFGGSGRTDRMMLSPVVEATLAWLEPKSRATKMLEKGAVLDSENKKNKRIAGSFPFALTYVPQTLIPSAWESFAEKCHEWLVQLEEDERQRKRIEEKQSFETSCRELAGEWQKIVVSIPLLNRWSAGRGARFHNLMTTISVQPNKENVQDAKRVFFDREFSDLAANWNQAVLQQGQLETLVEQWAGIPTVNSRLNDWVSQKPSGAFSLHRLSADKWPQKENLHLWLTEISNWIGRKNEFLTIGLPGIEAASNQRYEEALEKLKSAWSALPDGEQKMTMASILEKLAGKSEWPVNEIREILKNFGSDRIHATLSCLETQLQNLSLEYARALWFSRLHGDDDACRAVATLQNTFQNLRIGSNDFPVFRKALSLAPIWISTAQSSQSIPLEAGLFDIVMIDEATQCTLTNLLPLIYRGKTLVVLGDEHQLPPIFGVGKYDQEVMARHHNVEGYLSTLGHYGKNVYSTAVKVLPFGEGDVVSLNQHYRSNPLVIGFSNREIYNQSLQLRKDPEWCGDLPVAAGMYKVHVAGIARRGSNGRSWLNKPEADAVLAKVVELKTQSSLVHKSIGIVTPFRAQKDLIAELLETSGQAEVLVGTADTFQGDERDIMIFSPVVSHGMEKKPGAIRWIEDPHNRINVALTRARDANFIVGDFEVCRNLPGILGKLIEYCETIELLRETSPAELYLFSWMMIKGWNPSVQHPVAEMQVDFCLKAENGDRFAIEVDGKVGTDGEWIHLPEMDEARDVALRNYGYEPLRFPAKEVFQTPLSVIQKIEEALCAK